MGRSKKFLGQKPEQKLGRKEKGIGWLVIPSFREHLRIDSYKDSISVFLFRTLYSERSHKFLSCFSFRSSISCQYRLLLR